MQPPRISYLIAASQRSRTELLCRALADTGVAGRPAEYLLAEDPAKFPGWSFWLGGPYADGATDRESYLDNVYRLGTTDNGVFGVKLMWSNMPWPIRMFQETPRYAGMNDVEIFRAFLPNLRGIHMTRRDRIRQAVSWSRAAQDNVWFVLDDHPARPTGTPEYSFELILAMRGIIEEGERSWRKVFAELDVEPFELVYEEFTASENYERLLREVIAHIGVEAPAVLPPPRTHRQSDALNDEWTARFVEDLAAREHA